MRDNWDHPAATCYDGNVSDVLYEDPAEDANRMRPWDWDFEKMPGWSYRKWLGGSWIAQDRVSRKDGKSWSALSFWADVEWRRTLETPG